MTITRMGFYPALTRFESGLYSLDAACRSTTGELGIPLRSITELYGRPGVGKSSLAYYLAGKTALAINPKSRIDLCDLEILDPEYVVASLEHAGFDGTLNFMGVRDAKNKKRTHEEIVQELSSNLTLDAVSCSVLDSIGAIVPISESEGDVGEANMGRRAKLVAQFTRKTILNLRDLVIPKNMYIINHVLSVIGGRGHTTPGGESVKFLGSQRLMLWQDELITNSKDDIIAFVTKGQVEKLRYGARGRKFQFVVIPGYGVSAELSALFDCVELGLATRKSVVKLGSENMGYISKLVDSAKTGYSKTFQPFFDAIQEYKLSEHNHIAQTETESYDESEPINLHETSEDTIGD